MEELEKSRIYNTALKKISPSSNIALLTEAVEGLEKIHGYKDADEQIEICRGMIEQIKARDEANRIERERKAEKERAAAEAASKKRRTAVTVALSAAVLCVAFVVLLITVIIPGGKYNSAVALYNEGRYDEAIAAFKALDGYRDSAEQIEKCETAKLDSSYNAAVALIGSGDYIAAYESLIKLEGYKDSEEVAKGIFEEYKRAKLKAADSGDLVYIGSFEQDNDTSNGREDVEWFVLAKEGKKALVISKFALDCKQYNTTETNVTWEKCSLREWLNGEFINEAFSEEEQEYIMNTTVVSDSDPSSGVSAGNKTTDKVFIFSISEVNKYFSSESARQCQGTAYCYEKGAYKAYNGNCWWWLRFPDYSRSAAIVGIGGAISNGGDSVLSDSIAVRPAMWVITD